MFYYVRIKPERRSGYESFNGKKTVTVWEKQRRR